MNANDKHADWLLKPTANELADGILAIEDRIFLTKKEHQLFQNSATMLRQQQAEIEALKTENSHLKYEISSGAWNPVPWEGAEEWEPLAWKLCADEHGEESCHDLIWDMGVIPEPWGERWQKYEDEAKRMIAMVRKCTHPVKELTLTKEEIYAVWASGEYYTLDKDGSIDEFHFCGFC